jgi:hypothetical protein
VRRYYRGVTPLARALLLEKRCLKNYIAISHSGQNVWLFRNIPRDAMSRGGSGNTMKLGGGSLFFKKYNYNLTPAIEI